MCGDSQLSIYIDCSSFTDEEKKEAISFICNNMIFYCNHKDGEIDIINCDCSKSVSNFINNGYGLFDAGIYIGNFVEIFWHKFPNLKFTLYDKHMEWDGMSYYKYTFTPEKFKSKPKIIKTYDKEYYNDPIDIRNLELSSIIRENIGMYSVSDKDNINLKNLKDFLNIEWYYPNK